MYIYLSRGRKIVSHTKKMLTSIKYLYALIKIVNRIHEKRILNWVHGGFLLLIIGYVYYIIPTCSQYKEISIYATFNI